MAPKRGGLGRGLDALIPSSSAAAKEPQTKTEKPAAKNTKGEKKPAKKAAEQKTVPKVYANGGVEVSKGQIVMLRVSQIEPNRAQPRKYFDKEKLGELAASIREHGVVQPLLVQKSGKGYVIIAGERRWRASIEAGLKEVPVIIRDYSDQEVVEISLIENLQREDLNPIEEADAYVRLMDEFNLTQEAVASKVSKSRVAVTNSIRLLQLPEEIREMLVYGDIREGHARALLAVSDPAKQIEAARTVVKDGLSVRDTEKLARSIGRTAPKKRKAVSFDDDVVYRDLEEKLKVRLGTKVSIERKTKEKGRIEIEYYSQEDLERILEALHGGEGWL